MSKVESKQIRIRKNDEYRALLTETLPYEVPMLFSNDGLYRAIKSGTVSKIKSEHGLDIFEKMVTVPYKYKIKKNSYEPRELAVMHPAQQIETSLFYSNYDHLIVGLCQRSPITLRSPNSIASYYVERALANNVGLSKGSQQVEAKNGYEPIPKTGTSYFAYKKFPLLFKFYDSHEFLRLEKKFKNLTRMDISDCFNRIYTHTIAWAVKSKPHAKLHKTNDTSFESKFDKLLQNANHGETAGILIGPETSRIFAEIILQKIDLNIIEKAKKQNLEFEQDYTIRRYVDDYFIYSNSSDSQERIKRIIPDALIEYKLAINNSKTTDHSRPYITNISISRHNISLAISAFFNKYVEFKKEVPSDEQKEKVVVYFNKIDNTSKSVVQTIAAIKRAIGEHGSYDPNANYFLGTFKRFLSRIKGKEIKSDRGSAEMSLYFFLTATIEILFFYYSMTMRVRQTYQISEILLLIAKIVKPLPSDLKSTLIRKIVDESRSIIYQASTDFPEYKIEVMNLLLVIQHFGIEHLYSRELLSKVFDFEILSNGDIFVTDNLDYFQLMFLLSYIGNCEDFRDIADAAIKKSLRQFENKNWSEYAESVFTFFDLLSCPYVNQPTKIRVAKLVLRHISDKNLNSRADALIEEVAKRDWFFGWRQKADLQLALRRKELRTPY